MTRTRSRKIDRALFKLLVAVTYPLFFVAVAASRALPIAGLAGAGGADASIFTQALRTGEATIAIAFAG
jgi:hypothetical protein